MEGIGRELRQELADLEQRLLSQVSAGLDEAAQNDLYPTRPVLEIQETPRLPVNDLTTIIEEIEGEISGGDGGESSSLRETITELIKTKLADEEYELKLQVGPPGQTAPPLTQVHEGENNAPLADALRVQYVDGAYRLCLDVDRLYIGSALAGVFRPLADFFGVGGESNDALGLKLGAVYTENAYVGAKAVGELPTQEHSDRKVYPLGAYALDDGGGI